MWTSPNSLVVLLGVKFTPPYADAVQLGLLPVAERSSWEAELQRQPQRAALRLARYLWLRQQLARFTAQPAECLTLARGRYQKPYLPGRPLHFNCSHSGAYSLLALSRWPLGVDLEQDRPRTRYRQVAECFFHPQERQHLSELPLEQERGEFFRIWTRKEALAKAQGQAVSRVLQKVSLVWPAGLHWYAPQKFWMLDWQQGLFTICLCTRRRPLLLWDQVWDQVGDRVWGD